ncbi:putative transcription factor interactor and regulator CCHC(Zn) family [Helianthus anomalus]
MKEEYCPPHELQKLEDEFWQIKQDKGDNAGYTTRFKQLSVICPSQVDTPKKAIAKYICGLPECVGDFVEAAKPATIEEAYQLAAEVNDKRVLSGFFFTNPVKQAHQAIIVDSSGESINGSSDDFHENSSRNSSDGSSGNSSKDSSDDASSGSLDEAFDDTASTREAQPNRKRKEPSVEENLKPEPLRSVPILAKRAYNGSHPQCLRCTYHHPPGAGCRYCANCDKYGHLRWNCRFGPQH